MTETTHEALVGEQFGSRAAAYLNSAVHAQGADLDILAAVARSRPDARALDIGCGGGHATFSVAPHVREAVACDLSPEMLRVVARAAAERGLNNVTTTEGSAERLPFDDGVFDLVVSRYSAHHWPDLGTGLREAARVLKPDGVAVFVDTTSPGLPLLDTYFQAIEILRDCSHVRNHSRAEWEAAFARAGFVSDSTSRHRVRLEFASWVARMRTPEVQVTAIRALQHAVSASVTRYFATEPDGSYCIDVGVFRVSKNLAQETRT